MNRSTLRAAAMERADYRCEWPHCSMSRWVELAHLHGVGMGGRQAADDDANVAILCKHHHDVFDGRVTHGVGHSTFVLWTAYLTGHRPRRASWAASDTPHTCGCHWPGCKTFDDPVWDESSSNRNPAMLRLCHTHTLLMYDQIVFGRKFETRTLLKAWLHS